MNPDKKNIEIIKQFNLSPHPEGGWFREIVRSENSLIREDGQSRNFITGIYYLLERDAKSAWHRVKNADEIWIYLRGDPLNLWCLDNDNKLIRNLILDSNNPVEMIPSGYWQACQYPDGIISTGLLESKIKFLINLLSLSRHHKFRGSPLR